MAQGLTKLSTQIVPEVLAPMMQAELDKKCVLLHLLKSTTH